MSSSSSHSSVTSQTSGSSGPASTAARAASTITPRFVHPFQRSLSAKPVHGAEHSARGQRRGFRRRRAAPPRSATWPNAICPSFGGSRSGTRTRSPAVLAAAPRSSSSSSRFWNTPPDRTTSSRSRALGGEHAAPRRSPAPARRESAPRSSTRARPRRGRASTARIVGLRIHDRPARIGSQRERVRLGRARIGERLELDRRLALVADLQAHAAHRGDRVEQPAHARRERRAHARSSTIRATMFQRCWAIGSNAARQRLAHLRQPRRTPSATARGSRRSPPGIRTPAQAPGALEAVAGRRRGSRRPRSSPSVP